MNGRNASGRAISLLNDAGPRPSVASTSTMPSQDATSSSSSSSSRPTSASRGITAAPELSRSESWSPQKTNDSPSPKTPRYSYELRQPLAPFFAVAPQGKRSLTNGAGEFNLASYPAPSNSTPSQEMVVSGQTAPSQDHSQAQSTIEGNWKPITKNFPCQLAQEYGCTETFTTSGHASRHAKKHTGEKGVPCPMCPKRFARKDNRKQHLKTHENGRAAERYARTGAKLTSTVTTKKTTATALGEGGDGGGATDAGSSKEPRTIRCAKSKPLPGKRAGSPLPRLETHVAHQRQLSATSVVGSSHVRRTGTSPSSNASSSSCSAEDAQIHSPASPLSASACRTPQAASYVRDMSVSLTASPIHTHFPSNSQHLHHHSHVEFAPGLDALVIAAGVSR